MALPEDFSLLVALRISRAAFMDSPQSFRLFSPYYEMAGTVAWIVHCSMEFDRTAVSAVDLRIWLLVNC